MEQVSLQTGVKSDPNKIKSTHAEYFADLNARDKDATYFFALRCFIIVPNALRPTRRS